MRSAQVQHLLASWSPGVTPTNLSCWVWRRGPEGNAGAASLEFTARNTGGGRVASVNFFSLFGLTSANLAFPSPGAIAYELAFRMMTRTCRADGPLHSAPRTGCSSESRRKPGRRLEGENGGKWESPPLHIPRVHTAHSKSSWELTQRAHTRTMHSPFPLQTHPPTPRA